jgi:hypothetical protein
MTLWTERFDALHAAASAATGRTDFGDPRYHDGLRVLLRALDANPPATPVAEASATGLIVGALAGRLTTEAGWAQNPQALAERIERPLIVIGLPRTGTTALHQLLSQDPQFQGIERWLTGAPMVRPPRDGWEAHPQYQAVVQRIAAMAQAAPQVVAAHSPHADDVDECLLPMAQSFVCNWFASNLDVPDYDAWFRAQDETPSFERYREVLKLVGLGDSRRWLLKNPSHVFGVEALLNAFPDACVVQTHRHPAEAIASLMSLLGGIRDLMNGAPIDRAALLARETSFWAAGAARSIAAQDRHPGRFVNVTQAEIRQDPLAVVRRIYAHFDIPMSSEAEARFQAWAAANPPDGRSGHAYDAVPDAPAIAETFRLYIARYAL